MSQGLEKTSYSHESGCRAKPDAADRQIANEISAHLVREHKFGKRNVRVEGGFDREAGKLSIFFRGEMSREYFVPGWQDPFKEIAVAHVNALHAMEQYRTGARPLTIDDFVFNFTQLNEQSGALAKNAEEQKWGDSGEGLAVAVRAPLLQPWERYLAIDFRNVLDEIYNNPDGKVPDYLTNSGVTSLPLLADGKVSFKCIYRGADLYGIKKIVVARRHHSSISHEQFVFSIGKILDEYLGHFAQQNPQVSIGSPVMIINNGDTWNEHVRGFWYADAGTSDAKPQEEWYGAHGQVEDSGSGEDATKPSLLNTLIARALAVQIVGLNYADYARVSIDADMGKFRSDEAVEVWTRSTVRRGMTDDDLNHLAAVMLNKGLVPGTQTLAAERFGLLKPDFYRAATLASDYFDLPRELAPWNAVIDRTLL